MRKLLLALITAAALSGGLTGMVAAAPDNRACDTAAFGALQAAFLDTSPCEDHGP